MTSPREVMRRWLGRSVLGAVAVVVLLIGGLWVEHSLPIELPRPSGPWPVGRASRTVGADVTAWIWYPAAHSQFVAPYLPESIRTAWQRNRPGVINFLTRDLAKVRAHGVFDAPFKTEAAPAPVLLFRGGGSGGVLGHTALFEELASRGYAVIALEGGNTLNPETCAGRVDEDTCAGTLLDGAVAVMTSAIDRLSATASRDPLLGGHLDWRAVGVFGHSFGGAQALAFCAADPRCSAGVNIDGRIFASLTRTAVTVPFLWLLSDHRSDQDAESRQILAQIQSVYERQPADSRARIVIRGAHHVTFSEDGALLKSGALRGILRLRGALGIDGRRQVEATSYAVRSFFDASLKHTGSAQVVLASPSYPEIILVP